MWACNNWCILSFFKIQWAENKGMAKLGDMSCMKLLHATCPLSVFQISNLGNFVACDKICTKRHQIFLGENRNISCLCNLGTGCLLPTHMFGETLSKM